MASVVSLAPGVHFLPGAVNSLVVGDGRGGALLVDAGLDDGHPLTFCAASALQKEAAARLGKLEGVCVTLPGHGEPTPDLPGLVAANLAAYARTTAAVLEAVQVGAAGVDDLLVRVCGALGVTMESVGAVVLNRAVVSAHLTELLEAGQVRMKVHGKRLLFVAGE
ncbi:hypothetical protein [Deinococcus sp.]|uniref:hypothetical protein n=1 Tax=Deinococcus sp. TaxID=47478 RepID=UPI0025BA30FA|nr:hypothetical protein [Deinococcus sp.]